jgi:hypothetical protein
MTGKLPGTRQHSILFVLRMAEGRAQRGKRGSGAMIVATRSCFHRDMLGGEQVASKALKFQL